MRIPISVLVILSSIPADTAAAKELRVRPDTDVKPLLKIVTAGDSIVLENGTWSDTDLRFEMLPGTAEAPIHIRAETAGLAVLTGKTQLRFSGQYVSVSGFVVRNARAVSDVVQFRTHSDHHAHHCRLTDCVFEEQADFDAGMDSHWVSIFGTNNRIDHCYFSGKKNGGTTVVVWVTEETGHHRIDQNHFGPRPVLGKNGGETLRIGTSDVSKLDSGTIVEQNYFHSCDGEAEIISNKSGANIYRHNVFDECSGTLTLRHGHRCFVVANAFLGRRKRGTGGVRIIGRSHTVINNYFEGLRGDAERAALCMMNGIPDSPPSGYAPVHGAVVSHNTFVDCKVSLELSVGAGEKQSVAPMDCRITHNAFLPGKWAISRVHSEPIGFHWRDNRQQVGRVHENQYIEFDRVDLRFVRAADGLLRPTALSPVSAETASSVHEDIDGFPRSDTTVCGCDQPDTPLRQWPGKSSTGPRWMTIEDGN